MFLDTSALVEYLSGNEDVAEKIEDKRNLKASTITFFELFRGALRSDHQSHNKDVVENRLDWIKKAAFDTECAETAAEIEQDLEDKGERFNLADVLIAATAMENDSKILTADSDFQEISGLKVETL
jgi:tRNA(fMet)-specific endonuclease VapC